MNEYVNSKSNALSLPRGRDVASSKINGNCHMSSRDLHYLFTYDNLMELLRKVAPSSETLHDATFRYRYLNAALREKRAIVSRPLRNSVQTEFPDTATHGTLRAQSSPTSISTHFNSHLAENLVEPSGQYEIP